MKVKIWVFVSGLGLAVAGLGGGADNSGLSQQSEISKKAHLKAEMPKQVLPPFRKYEPYRVTPVYDYVSPIGYSITSEPQPNVILFSAPLGKNSTVWEVNFCIGTPK